MNDLQGGDSEIFQEDSEILGGTSIRGVAMGGRGMEEIGGLTDGRPPEGENLDDLLIHD